MNSWHKRFNNDVMVVQIPSHTDYSDRIKRFLWSNGREISENAERNRVEYASEGWDWHTVLEDDDMYVDASTGELIHPCWYDDVVMEDISEEGEDDYFEAETQTPTLSRSNSFVIGLDQLSE